MNTPDPLILLCFYFLFLLAALGLHPSTQTVVVAHRLSYFMACGLLVPPPGIKHTSPALAGGFLTSGPPGKFRFLFFYSAYNLVTYYIIYLFIKSTVY